MGYLFSKVFPYLWPYIKELISGWIKHPYFKEHGYRMAMKKFGIICLFVAFVAIGGEYLSTLRELDLIKQEVKSKPPAYVSFEDVKNYHTLFNSPETMTQLNQCRADLYTSNSQIIELTHRLELERQLHEKTKQELEVLKSKPARPATSKPTEDSRDAVNRRLNPRRDN